MNDILKHLFDESEKIFACNLSSSYATTDHFIGTAEEQLNESENRQFYCLNPIRGTRRLKTEVKQYRNFLFEDDHTPLEKQFKNLEELKTQGIISAAVYSGGKSIHLIVSCADDLDLGEVGSEVAEQRYKNIWLGLKDIIEGFGACVDDSGKNPVTLTRMPGAKRGNKVQEILYKGKLVSADFLKSVAKEKALPPIYRTMEFTESLEELEKRMSGPEYFRLYMEIHYGAWIRAKDGNYPHLFRITCWAIDQLGATPNSMMELLQKYVEPKLIQKSYFKDWAKPVKDAFKHKGLL